MTVDIEEANAIAIKAAKMASESPVVQKAMQDAWNQIKREVNFSLEIAGKPVSGTAAHDLRNVARLALLKAFVAGEPIDNCKDEARAAAGL